MKDSHPHCQDGPEPVLHDLRAEQADPHEDGRTRQGKTLRRWPKEVDAVVLHQAGVEFGARRGEPLHRRALEVACHAMAFRDGSAVLAAPATWYLKAAHRLNSRSVSLEVDGDYPGLLGGRVGKRRDGSRKTPTELTQLTIDAARLALRALVATAREDGCPIRYILAHRQADSWRRRDPGAALWAEVALACGVDELGLATLDSLTEPNTVKGRDRRGLPIPAAWGGPSFIKY